MLNLPAVTGPEAIGFIRPNIEQPQQPPPKKLSQNGDRTTKFKGPVPVLG
jgi:hypothetical protein